MKPRKPIIRKAPLKRSAKPIARTPLKRSMKKISKKSATQILRDKRYSPLAKKFKEENQECMARISPYCSGVTSDVHHPFGTIGELYFNVEDFIAVCRFCHDYIGSHHQEAVDKGLCGSRTNK